MMAQHALLLLLTPNFWGRPFWSFLEMAGSHPDRPLRTLGLLLRPVISLGDLLQLWHPTSHLHWGSRAMIRQSLHSPPHWDPQFLDPDIFRTESPFSTVCHESPSQQILKSKHVLESQGDVLEKSQGRHITKIQFKGCIFTVTICRCRQKGNSLSKKWEKN